MKQFTLITALLLGFVACSCGSKEVKSSPETAGVDIDNNEVIADDPNENNTGLYDVDFDDPYLVSNGTFLNFKPGEPLDAYIDILREGSMQTGEGSFKVYYIDGAEGNELGYLMTDPIDKTLIGDIFITSPAVVTEDGVRIGTTYEQLIERIGRVSFHGSEIESRVYGNSDGISYRLDMVSNQYDLDNDKILPNTKISEIVIARKRNM